MVCAGGRLGGDGACLFAQGEISETFKDLYPGLRRVKMVYRCVCVSSLFLAELVFHRVASLEEPDRSIAEKLGRSIINLSSSPMLATRRRT